MRRAVQGVDCIFHQAALASVQRSVERPLDTHEACVTGTLVLIDEARQAKVRRIVYAASSSAYGNQPSSSKRETDLPLPISPYGAAKLAAEYYLSAFAAMGDIETVALRYFNVFGPRQDPHSEYSAVIPRFITAMLSGRAPIVYGDGQQSRDFTYVENVVKGNLLAASAPAKEASGRVFNIAAGGKISLLELIAALNKLLEDQLSTAARAAAHRRRPRKHGRHHASATSARLRARDRIRRRPAALDRLLRRTRKSAEPVTDHHYAVRADRLRTTERTEQKQHGQQA